MNEIEQNLNATADTDEGLDIFAEFAVDDDGVWFPYSGKVEFLIARMQNPKFRRRLNFFSDKFRRVLDGKGQAAVDKSDEIMATVMGETILMGWKGKVSLKGEVLEYSTENAIKLLRTNLFREWVAKMANDEHAYKTVKEQEDISNL